MGDFDTREHGRKLAAEFIGAFALIFIGAAAIIQTGGQNLVAIAIAHGLAIALLVSSLGHISGGLFNPALTIGLWATRRLDTISTVAYIIAQLLGAVVAALALVLVFPEALRDAVSLGVPLLGRGIDFAQGVIIEAIATFFLMLAVFGTALDPRGPKLGGFGIGLILTMDILAVGTLTGAAMNRRAPSVRPSSAGSGATTSSTGSARSSAPWSPRWSTTTSSPRRRWR